MKRVQLAQNFFQRFGCKHNFRVQRFTFSTIGIDPRSAERIVARPLLLVVPLMGLLLYSGGVVHFSYVNCRDILLVTSALSAFLQGLLAIWKITVMLYLRQRFTSLVNKLGSWNSNANDEDRLFICEENGKDALFSIFYFMSVLISALLALVPPIYTAIASYISDGVPHLVPPYVASYLGDVTQPLPYSLAYLSNFFAIHFIAMGSVGTDTLFSWLMRNMIAHLRLLQRRFHQAAQTDDGRSSQATIADCIAYHYQVIEVIEELNAIFGTIVFVKFVISCFQICVLGYQVSRGASLNEVSYPISFLVAVCMQLFLYCYVGQLIQDESEYVAMRIFLDFRFNEMSSKMQKLLLLPMQRAQRPCNVTGTFFIVNLSLFLWVFRTGGSYITLLITLDSK